MFLIVEDRGAHRTEDIRLAFCGLAGEDPVAADEQAVIDDQLDVVLLGNELGTKAFARSALADQCVDFLAFQLPERIFKNAIHGFHYSKIPV